MAIAIRQEKSAQGGAVASLAVTLTSTTLSGSVVVVAASMDSGGTDITFTDDKSDSPTDSGSGLFTGGTGKSRMAAFLVTTTGAQVFTAHFTGSPAVFTEVVAWEVTGLTSATFDKHVHGTADSTAASSGSTGTLSTAAEAGLGYIFTSNAMATGTQGAGWTQDEITSGNGSMVQHIVTAATTAITATGTVTPSAANWDAWAVTLQSGASTNPFVSNVTGLPPVFLSTYRIDETWIDQGLAILPKQSATKPFLQTDWPNPYPVTWFRGWQEAGNTQIPFQNFTKPFKQTEWPNPYPVQWYQSWTQVGTLPTQSTTKPFKQSDWPNPQPVVWYQNWIQVGTLPTPSTQKPFNQSDYPNPYPVTWYRSIEGIGNALRAITQNPFFQTDWPLPQPVTWYRSWEEPGNSVLPQPSTTFPFVQTDYPNPPRVIWDRFWSQSPAQPLVTNPFFQLDWPNPPRTVWYQSLTVPGNTLLPVGNPFFQNVDAPLPTVPQPIDQTWIQNLAEFYQANTFPFSQTDWENPPPVYWFRDYNQNLVLYLPVGQKPFSQTDWPLTQAQRPIDQTWLQTLALNLPTPPPPPVQAFGGKQWYPDEWEKRVLSMWMKNVRSFGK